jgi:glucose-6-phosphate isomerase
MSIEISGRRLANLDSPALRKLLAVTPALAAKDATLWGPEAQSEAAIRLNWIDLPTSSRALLPQLAELKIWAESAGLTQVILAGMGGSSLAPEAHLRPLRNRSLFSIRPILIKSEPQSLLT